VKVERKYHGNRATAALVGFLILLGIGAFNSENNLLFLVFALVQAAVLVSGIISGAMMMNLKIERQAPASVTLGSPLLLRYVVRNTGRFMPALALTILEIDEAELARGSRRRGRGASRNGAGGSAGPARGGLSRLLGPARGFVGYLAPGQSQEVIVLARPTRRGELHLPAVRIVSGFPFGMVRKSVTVHKSDTVLVLPEVRRLRREAYTHLVSRSDVGQTSTALKGRGDEFYGLRSYSYGDSPRLISWKSSARLGSLVVRENASSASGQLWVVLSFPPGPGAVRPENAAAQSVEALREDSITLVASLIEAALASGVEPGLIVIGADVCLQPATGGRQRGLLMESLARLDAEQLASTAGRSAKGEAGATRGVVPPRGPCIVVHAGEVDPTVGPAGASHVRGADLASLSLLAGATSGAGPRLFGSSLRGPA